MGYVYILKSLKNDRYYIGSSKNFERRIDEHKKGNVKATVYLLPVKCVFLQEYDSILKARKIEYWLKRQKDRTLIERIIFEGKITKEV